MGASLTESLLPPNSSALDRAAEAVMVRHLAAIPQPHRMLWNPDNCPLELLPWLAWALSVDEWSDAWSEAHKRAAIKRAIALHRKRGTPWAVEQAMLRAGIEAVQVIERPQGAHWAEFDIEISIKQQQLAGETLVRAIAQVEAFKAKRSHLRRLILSLSARAGRQLRPFCLEVSEVTIFPSVRTELTAHAAQAGRPLAVLETQSIEIYPR